MALIEHVWPWTQQPQGYGYPVFDPRWGLTPDLVFVPSARGSWSYGSACSEAVGIHGRSAELPGGTQTSANVITRSGGVTAARTKCTFVCVARIASGAPYQTLASFKYSASSQGLYLADANGIGNEIGIAKGGVTALAHVTLSYGSTYVIVASHRQDTGEYYVLARDIATGGVLRNSQVDTQASTAGNGVYCVGSSRSDGVTGSLAGSVYLSVGSFSWLPESAATELLRNPWQLFAPIERRIWVPEAGVSTVPNITFVGAENILVTSADYRVTLDYA